MNFSLTVWVCAFLQRETFGRQLWESALPEFNINNKAFNEDKIQIASLNGTLHPNTLSHLNVTELRLVRNQIREIEDGAFCSSKNVKVLEIDFNQNTNPPQLTKNMFTNCNLEELFIKFDYNTLGKVNPDVFENLNNLKVFGIDSAELVNLTTETLKLPQNLNTLILSNIHVKNIDSDYFTNLTSLERLEISHNIEFDYLPKNLFQNLSKLKWLNIYDNILKNVTWDEFDGLTSLEELNISDNQIHYFNADKIAKAFPKLKKLYTDLNPVQCQAHKKFIEELEKKLSTIEEIDKLHASC